MKVKKMVAEKWLDLALKSKDPEKKLEYFSKYLELNPNNEDVWRYKFHLLDYQQKEEEKSNCAYEIVKRRNDFLDERLSTLFSLGSSSGGPNREPADYESAIVYFDDVLREKPDYVWAWIYKGDALLYLERHAEALVCYDKVLKLNPSKPCRAFAWAKKASALELLGKFEEAIECCNSSLDIDPGNPVIWGLKGESLSMIGDFEKAIACYDEALRINPSDEMAREDKEMIEKELRDRSKRKEGNIVSEEILGIIPAWMEELGLILRKTTWVGNLVFTTNRLIVAEEKRGAVRFRLLDPYMFSHASARDRLRMKEISAESILKVNVKNFEIPYSDIAVVEVTPKFGHNRHEFHIFMVSNLNVPKYKFVLSVWDRHISDFKEFLRTVLPSKV